MERRPFAAWVQQKQTEDRNREKRPRSSAYEKIGVPLRLYFSDGTEALGVAWAGAAPGEGAGAPSGRGAFSGSIWSF